VLLQPGIFETEKINLINNGTLGNYFNVLPQYSQIDESILGQYYTPSQDKQLIDLAK